MHLESYPEAAVPRALRAQVLQLHNEAWPSDPTTTASPPAAPTEAAASIKLTARTGDPSTPDTQPAPPAPLPDPAAADAPVHDPALRPLSMLLVDEGVVVAALDILRKPLRHAGSTFEAGGLSTVVTRADLRGRGYGHRLVTAARAAMLDLQLDLGIFTCDRPLRPFYESAGWRLLPGTVLVGGSPDAPFPSDQPGFDKVTLAAFFTPAAQQAEATFHDARIQLYPGHIDKLW